MNIGDKVRVIAGKEEGIVIAFLPGGIVEVELEAGFSDQYLSSALAVVSAKENEFFGKAKSYSDAEKTKKEETTREANSLLAEKGLYMAFEPYNDKIAILKFINNTDLSIPFTYGEENAFGYKGVSSGMVSKKSALKLRDIELGDFENWPTFIVQAFVHKIGKSELKAPLIYRHKIKAKTFYNSKRKAPITGSESYLFQMDGELPKINPEEIKSQLFEPNPDAAKTIASKNQLSRPSGVVDLHLESITAKTEGMDDHSMLKLQMEVFERKLTNAIALGMKDIIFIHGVGNGVLKNKIYNKLVGFKIKNDIENFVQASVLLYGQGAVQVLIKTK